MKLPFQLVCLLPVFAGLLHAEVPRKPLPSKYRSLWTDSPFTTKPTGPTIVQYNEIEDYVLLGVSPIEDGYRVTVINRKRPQDERIIVETNRENDGLKIDQVIHKAGEPLKTRVKLSKGGKSAFVEFEDKFLTLKVAPAAPQPNRPNNRAQPPGTNTQQQPNTRVPRRRIIPPTSGGGQNRAPNNNQSNRRTPTPRTR